MNWNVAFERSIEKPVSIEFERYLTHAQRDNAPVVSTQFHAEGVELT